MSRIEDLVRHQGKLWVVGVDMKPAWPTAIYRKLVLPVVWGVGLGFISANVATYHIYKTLVQDHQQRDGQEASIEYSRQALRELEGQVSPTGRLILEDRVSPAGRLMFLGAEFYLNKYITHHTK